VQLARPAKHYISYAVLFVSELSLLACSAPSLSGVFSELKPALPLIVFSRIRRRMHDTFIPTTTIAWTVLMLHFVTDGLISMKVKPAVFSKNQT